MIDLKHFLQESLANNQYHYTASIQALFIQYLELLHRWNQTINLTAIRDPDEMVTHHILDSLAILPYLQGQRLIDVGSGAGLPGIPLAIVQPEKEFFLLDSNSKKTRFLTQAVLELGLKNVSVIHSRSERFYPDKCFDTVITRAFSSLREMLLLTKHLICPQGQFLAMKGIYPGEEIKEIPKEFKLLGVHELKINGLNEKRCLVILS